MLPAALRQCPCPASFCCCCCLLLHRPSSYAYHATTGKPPVWAFAVCFLTTSTAADASPSSAALSWLLHNHTTRRTCLEICLLPHLFYCCRCLVQQCCTVPAQLAAAAASCTALAAISFTACLLTSSIAADASRSSAALSLPRLLLSSFR
jgi:hypothetical protein